MPAIERWEHLPEGVRQHLIDRMRDEADRQKLPSTVSAYPDIGGPVSAPR